MLWGLLLIPLITKSASQSCSVEDDESDDCWKENGSMTCSQYIDNASCQLPIDDICTTGGINLKDKKSHQSSNYKDFISEKAFDESVWNCSHTHTKYSWWQIDLEGVYNISSVFIFNKHTHETDISGAEIYIGSSRENNGTANSKCQSITNFSTNCYNRIDCDSPLLGRYITVFSSKTFVILCDLKVCGKQIESPFVIIKENKTWEQALDYCRSKHTDLASIVNSETQAWAELEAMTAETSFVWLGLRYTCTLGLWFWVQDHCLEYKHWAKNGMNEECDQSVAMESEGEHFWYSKTDRDTFNFICEK